MLNKILDRPVSVTMILFVFVVLGIVGIRRLPVSLIPDVDIPYVTVQVNDREKSARELDEAVVQPLRQALEQISHVKDIRSESCDGTASITLSFEEGHDMDYIYIEVNEKVDRVLSSLPKMERPKVYKASATDIPAFFINVTLADASGAESVGDPSLFPVGDRFRKMSGFVTDVISKRIEQLPEVAMVDVSGTVDDEILVIPDADALHALGLTLDEFESCVSSANVNLSNLTIRDGEYHYNVKFHSFARSAEDIADMYVRCGDRTLQIKDMAEVLEHPARRSGLVTSDGRDAVSLAVIKQGDARMADLHRSISEQIEAFGSDYPELEFTVTRDQTELLDYSIKNLLLNIIAAILLDCLVIFLFMKDVRTPLLVSVTIPLSLVMSFFVFYVLGVTINIISLSGLLLGVGMMVDNTIVLTDNITGRWTRGDDLRTAVVEGTAEVRGAMLSSVLTTCAVFIPLVFLNGLAGELFFDQAVTITVLLLVSYLVTVIVIPVYYWALYRKQPAFKPNSVLSKIEFRNAGRFYDRVSGWFLANRWTAWAIPVVCAAAIALCVAFMPKEKVPPITYTDAILKVDWNEHVTLEENRRRVEALEGEIAGLCTQYTAMVGMQQFVLGHSGDQGLGEASLYFKCADARDLAVAKSRMDAVMSSRYPSAVREYATSGNVFDMVFSEKEPELVARLRPSGDAGMDIRTLSGVLEGIRRVLPDVRIDDIPGKTDVLYVSDPELMALYGLSFSDLTGALTNALDGNEVFEIVQGSRIVPVVMGTDVRKMEDILARTVITVRREDGGTTEVPAGVVMRQGWERDFKTLISGGEGNYYPVEMDVPASSVKDVMSKVTGAVRDDGHYEAGFTGAWFSNMEIVRQMGLVLLVAILLLFLILASQFESLVQPVIILSEVVIDIGVCLAALWALGVSINLMSLIGLVVICGIVINDSILKIDTINQLCRQGWQLETAIHEAGHRRLKSIVMTSVTTIFAVAPFLSRGNMGADLQYPMALVIIVGMAVGTMVSLFYVPVVYATIYWRRR